MFYFVLLIVSFLIIFLWAVFYINRPYQSFVNNIKYSLVNNEPKKFFNNQTEKYEKVTSSTSKKAIEEVARVVFANYKCKNCGSTMIEGNNIVIKFNMTLLYKDTEKNFLFFSKIYPPVKPYKRIFDFDSIYAKKGNFSDTPGYIKCRTCKWNITADHTNDKVWLTKSDLEKMITTITE